MKKNIYNDSAATARERMIKRQSDPVEQKKTMDAHLGNKAQIYNNEIERVGIKEKFYKENK